MIFFKWNITMLASFPPAGARSEYYDDEGLQPQLENTPLKPETTRLLEKIAMAQQTANKLHFLTGAAAKTICADTAAIIDQEMRCEEKKIALFHLRIKISNEQLHPKTLNKLLIEVYNKTVKHNKKSQKIVNAKHSLMIAKQFYNGFLQDLNQEFPDKKELLLTIFSDPQYCQQKLAEHPEIKILSQPFENFLEEIIKALCDFTEGTDAAEIIKAVIKTDVPRLWVKLLINPLLHDGLESLQLRALVERLEKKIKKKVADPLMEKVGLSIIKDPVLCHRLGYYDLRRLVGLNEEYDDYLIKSVAIIRYFDAKQVFDFIKQFPHYTKTILQTVCTILSSTDLGNITSTDLLSFTALKKMNQDANTCGWAAFVFKLVLDDPDVTRLVPDDPKSIIDLASTLLATKDFYKKSRLFAKALLIYPTLCEFFELPTDSAVFHPLLLVEDFQALHLYYHRAKDEILAKGYYDCAQAKQNNVVLPQQVPALATYTPLKAGAVIKALLPEMSGIVRRPNNANRKVILP